MIRVVLADDHVILREGLVQLLKQRNFDVVGEADDGEKAVELIREKKPDIALLDLTMPGLSGIGIAEMLTREKSETRVIILTMYKERSYVSRAFAAGVWGYVLKEDAFGDLEYAINAVMSGKKFLSPSLADVFSSSDVFQQMKLTKREEEILKLIAMGFTNKEIAKRLFISVKTVETHRARIMQKLDLHNTADLVRYASRVGLL